MQLKSNNAHNQAVMNEETLGKALQEIRTRIARYEHERRELDRALTASREEERLLTQLLALRTGSLTTGLDTPILGNNRGTGTRELTDVSHVSDDSKHPAVQAVVRELAVAGRPLHISDLMRILRDGHVQIPGAGTQANLITHLRRDPRLVRPSRGMYGLLAWGLENMPTSKRRKRRKRRVRSTSSNERTE